MTRNHTILAVLLLMMVAATATANAQSDRSITVKVPFDFVVENQKLPAGEYRVQALHSDRSDRMLLRREGGGAVTTVFTLPVRTLDAASESKLVFKRYGSQYFLSQIWMQSADAGREVLIGRAEQEAAKANGSKRLVVLAQKQK
ncbi:MAG TPA: hypothetical protein VLE48_10730 [Terriglobales bacterium]|nr:hypothetical protein [Terriglobales bacterium]